MASLNRNLRKDLENAVKKARRVAEAGARQAIEQLAVNHHEPWPALTPEQRKLRNRLRAHGRQLGDRLDERTGAQSIDRIVGECAYEHWHRLLFARFLAENDLLVEPESGMALSLDECRDLARERSVDWLGLASDFAQRMLPQIFRVDDPVLAVSLPPEIRQQLETILEGLSRDVFAADDSLGWVYQFWQADRKQEVNDSGNKIGADELPAVTQLFTEDYMVDFLLDNTLGAWHAGKVLAANPKLAESAQSEDELRSVVSLPGCPWTYLRFIKSDDGRWAPASGTFEGWPKTGKELKCLDPCMGSGHFVVAMFQRFVALRIAEEGLNEQTAVGAVIGDNLFGLEIDPRCTQIGAFNLALAAWRRVGHCALPAMNIACSGLAPNAREADWLALAGDNEKLKNGMERLYRLFTKAAVLGSLINPRAGESDLFVAAFHELQPLLEKALAQEAKDDTAHEMAVTARGIAKAAEILAGQFTLVATNVPYLGRLKQDSTLKDYCENVYPKAKADLATCFIQRCLELSAPKGTSALVAPQIWLFLKTYGHLRTSLLATATWNFVAKLGTKAFESIGGEVVNVNLQAISRDRPSPKTEMFGLDVGDQPTVTLKSSQLTERIPMLVSQTRQFKNPNSTIVFESSSNLSLLEKYADSTQGASTLDIEMFRFRFWEVSVGKEWILHQSTPAGGCLYSGLEYVSVHRKPGGRFERLAIELKAENRLGGAWSGQPVWGKLGISCAWMGSLPTAIYVGAVYDNSIAAIVPKDVRHLDAIWAFCSSATYFQEVRKLNQKSQVANATLVYVPFDLAHWQKVAAEKYPHGLPKPFSSDPTQWLFNGHPAGADQPLQVAVARLLGYQWPRQTGSSFPDCPALDADGLETRVDDDGIVCLPSIKGESPAAARLQELLAAAYGSDWSALKLDELLRQAGADGKSLEDWLRADFAGLHCALFHQRPFVLQIWDGFQNGFSALVNYHKLAAPNGEGKRTLEKLIYTYLGDWIDRQRADQKAGVEGADGRVAAAEHLKRELEKILEGEPPYDIFVRWKPLHEQPVGWEPDINDGVRINIRPFMAAKPLNARGKNASILRVAPKIKWEKDRGKEPYRLRDDYPWFWNWDGSTPEFRGGEVFDGNRHNDLHYSRAAKLAARESFEKGAK